MRAAGTSLLLLLGVSCTHVQSSAYATGRPLPPSSAAVRISATRDPPQGAEELGLAEAHGGMGVVTLEEAIAEFRARVASMGGDYGRIDRVATKHQVVDESYTYECGSTRTTIETTMVSQVNADGSVSSTSQSVPVTTYVSQTCTGTRQVDVSTLSVIGRAFRTGGRR